MQTIHMENKLWIKVTLNHLCIFFLSINFLSSLFFLFCPFPLHHLLLSASPSFLFAFLIPCLLFSPHYFIPLLFPLFSIYLFFPFLIPFLTLSFLLSSFYRLSSFSPMQHPFTLPTTPFTLYLPPVTLSTLFAFVPHTCTPCLTFRLPRRGINDQGRSQFLGVIVVAAVEEPRGTGHCGGGCGGFDGGCDKLYVGRKDRLIAWTLLGFIIFWGVLVDGCCWW